VNRVYLLVLEVFSRDLRDRRAVARYAGLTGRPGRETALQPSKET
jgi:hypothetical protein